MKKIIKKNVLAPLAVMTLVSVSQLPLLASADSATGSQATQTASSSQTMTVGDIITKGNTAIAQRLTTLGDLVTNINSSSNKLTTSDKSYLLSEVNGASSGLASLKSTLDAETSLKAARADYADIFSEYRVYLLVKPKVNDIKTADVQQAREQKLTTEQGKLQTRFNKVGKNNSQTQSLLTSMQTELSNAKGISSSVETGALPITPAQFNTNPTVMKNYSAQLKQATDDNQTAVQDAKQIVTALKSLK
jgi:hypothetical protein